MTSARLSSGLAPPPQPAVQVTVAKAGTSGPHSSPGRGPTNGSGGQAGAVEANRRPAWTGRTGPGSLTAPATVQAGPRVAGRGHTRNGAGTGGAGLARE